MEQKNKEDFKINELCWAKIKGFPWWPALIKDIKYLNKDKKYTIGFICENKGSDLDSINLKKWKKNYDKFKTGWILPKDKKSFKQNDFECSLLMADKYYEGIINSEEHYNFLIKYNTTKERHSLYNIHNFIKEIESQKKENKDIKKNEEFKKVKEKYNIEINESKIKYENKNKMIGRKRKKKIQKQIIELSDDEKENENENQNKKIEEFEMTRKDLDKSDKLLKSLTNNLDEIVIRSEKYQKYFEKECKEKNISSLNDKNIKTKIELVNYIQIMNDVLNIPISLEKIIPNEEKKEKEVKIA